jgi:hypothetical protein
MALSIMYGANFDTLKTLGNLPGDIPDSEGAALAALFNRRGYEDSQIGNIDVAIRKDNFKLKDNTDNIKQWIKDNDKFIKKSFQNKIEEINDQLAASKVAAENEEFQKLLDPNVPPPMPDWIAANDPKAFITLLENPSLFKIGDWKGEFQKLFGSKFYSGGRMKDPFIQSIGYLTTQHGKYSESTRQLLIPLEIELEIDGIGGIYPGNSFHSNYLPKRYQEETVFQAFDINHRVGSEGWTVVITGKMRTTLEKVLRDTTYIDEIIKEQIENYEAKRTAAEEKAEEDRLNSSGGVFSKGAGAGIT